MQTVADMIRHLKPCGNAMQWATDYTDVDLAWQECTRADWMLWLIGRCDGIDRNTIVLCAADFAEDALPHWTARYPDDSRVADCIAACRRWAAGEISDSDLAAAGAAAEAAWAAAGAAEAAAWAAWAAAGAAEAAAGAAEAAAWAAEAAAWSAEAAAGAAEAAAWSARAAAWSARAATWSAWAAARAAARAAAEAAANRRHADIVRKYWTTGSEIAERLGRVETQCDQ